MNPTATSAAPVILDRAGLAWFNEIKNRALAVIAATPKDKPPLAEAVAAVSRIAALPANSLTQHEVFELEDWLVVLLPLEDLKQWVYSLREDYREAFGKESFERIQPTLLPQVSLGKIEELQAEARRLMQELHWQASILPWAQAKRADLVKQILWMFGAVLAVTVISLGISVVPKGPEQMQFAAVVALMGAIGAFVSSLERVQKSDLATSRALAAARHGNYELGVALSPLQGSIFALVLTLILVGRLTPPGFIIPDVSMGTTNCPCATNVVVATNQFQTTNDPSRQLQLPNLKNPDGKGQPPVTNPNLTVPASTSVGTSVPPVAGPGQTPPPGQPTANAGQQMGGSADQVKPPPTMTNKNCDSGGQCRFPFFKLWLCFGSGKDIALLLLWAFLAGFSERLVPDMLSRIEKQGKA